MGRTNKYLSHHFGDRALDRFFADGPVDDRGEDTENDADRELIHSSVCGVSDNKILITHGTDSMVDTTRALQDISAKTIVLFGAMQPARMRYGDAMYNLGVASAAVQILPAGVHLVMNGLIFDPGRVIKNRAQNRFEQVDG